ncbi:MAG TPA: hypothetical protein VG675_15665 [Bryobacteraceae bacterium]|nr:hypothetical protein [Bryobacteraceae bacterium]
MCHKATVRRAARLIGLAGAVALVLAAQVNPSWRKVGTSSVELRLASPATGPVERVWYSADGSELFARTFSGRVFGTVDFETWTPVAPMPEPSVPAEATVARLPEAGARAISAAPDGSRIYALGQQLFRSDDGGRSWVNLTAFQAQSVVGPGQNSIAVSPSNPDQIVVGNDFGVWRSLDGGRSWAGLNQFLPNLMVNRILSTPNGTGGVRVETERLGALELAPGSSVWAPVESTEAADEAAVRQRYSATLGASITAVGASGETVYAGSADGRLWVSFDSGRTWRPSPPTGANGAVERIFVDPVEPRVALAAIGGSAAHVLRTTNSGSFWDDLSANLPNVPAHGITADRAAGAIYVATDSGVFYGVADLENAATPAVNWVNLTEHLPQARATDVRLDAAAVQLYIALDGYGIYATNAPHRARSFRIVNAADFSARAAAPGSLVSVIGGRVSAARGGELNYPVLAAANNESQIQVPFNAEGPNVSLALQTSGGTVTVGLAVQPVSPAIFIGHDGAPLLLNGDTGLLVDAQNTAHANSLLQILATGLGKVTPDWPTGMAAPMENPPVVAASVKAFLDGYPVPVTRATLAPGYIGFYLIEVQLPQITNYGPSDLYLSADGKESNHVQVVIEP